MGRARRWAVTLDAFLNTILNFDTEHYITITGLEVNEDTITLNFESEEGSPEIIENSNIDLRVVIDEFISNHRNCQRDIPHGHVCTDTGRRGRGLGSDSGVGKFLC